MNYGIDYIASEYQSIIECPTNRARRNPATHVYPPSPPLTEYYPPQLKMSNKPITPPLVQTNKSSSLNHVPMSLRYFIETVVQRSKTDTGTLLLSLSYARRLRLKLYDTSKGKRLFFLLLKKKK